MDSFQHTLKLAFAAHNAGRHADAEALCRTLLQINSSDAQLLFLLGMILHKTSRDAEAAGHLRRAAETSPDVARIFSGLGYALQGVGNDADAVKNFARATELEPANADHFYSLGNAWHKLGELENARAAFQTAVALKPNDAASWNNLGKIFKQLNQLDDSITAYARAVEISPGYILARHGWAISLLTAGRLAEGFREYQSRVQQMALRKFSQPRWQGESVAGKTVFIHAEQGFGDGIHFARFVPLVRERAARVMLECRPELKSLLVFSGVADEVIAFGEPVPPFDVFTSIMNLPGLLGVTLEDIPNRVPYLKSPAAGDLPPAKNGKLKVGFVWAGNPAHSDDAARSLTLEMFAPILQTPGITFYNLQLAVPARDETLFHSLPNVVNLSPLMKDFLATAVLVQQLDLVISVDTSVAHLAGALAKPVWTLVQFDADWRWFLEHEDTPWYPTMRLFRQPQRNQWRPVVARVADELRQLAAACV